MTQRLAADLLRRPGDRRADAACRAGRVLPRRRGHELPTSPPRRSTCATRQASRSRPTAPASTSRTRQHAILEFDRGANGVLTLKAGAAVHGQRGCPCAVCLDADADGEPAATWRSTPGNNLYVASRRGSGSVTALQIDGGRRPHASSRTGRSASRMRRDIAGADGCAVGTAVSRARARSSSRDGTVVYVGSATAGSSLRSDARPRSGTDGDGRRRQRVLRRRRLPTAARHRRRLEFRRHQRHRARRARPAVCGARRNANRDLSPSTRPGDGLVRRADAAGCVGNAAVARRVPAGAQLVNPSGLAATADGEDVYADDRRPARRRDSTARDGSIAQRADTRGCHVHRRCATTDVRHAAVATMAGPATAPSRLTATTSTSWLTTGRPNHRPQARLAAARSATTPQITVPPGSRACSTSRARDEDGDPLDLRDHQPAADLGDLGSIDQRAAKVNYTASRATTASPRSPYRASYTSFATFEAIGSITVNVVGDTVQPATEPRCRQRPGRVLRAAGLQRQRPEDPARRGGDQGQPDRRELRHDRRAVPDADVRRRAQLGADLEADDRRSRCVGLSITQQLPKGISVR